MSGLTKRQFSKIDLKQISNQLFVSIVKYGKIVDSLYNEQLRKKYGELYNDFLNLEKQINEETAKK